MRYCSVRARSPVCWRALFARFPPSAHRASQLRTYSFAHTQPTLKLPCSRAQPSATVARALLSPWQRTLWSLWQVFKAKQGEKNGFLRPHWSQKAQKWLLKCALATSSRFSTLVRHTCQPLHLRPEKRVQGTATQNPMVPLLKSRSSAALRRALASVVLPWPSRVLSYLS